jgi:NAD(P)-dependent dehydrogenase (short-subunit alcohol dehydrogenase family)
MTDDFFKLRGKVAIVWGGGLGMGERSAIRLAEAGCDVAVVDVERERADRVCEAIRGLGRRAVPLVADVTNEAQVIATVAASDEQLGPVDCMVTVVGLAFWKPLLDVDADEWEKAFAINLKSFFYTARAVAKSLIAHDKPGAIVGVCSVSGLQSGPLHGPYGAAKAGLANLVKTMAVEWGPSIRVNAIAPGAIKTPRLKWTEEAIASFKDRIGLQRPGETDEIGKVALFLASDLASYVTGLTVPVDGGWMAEYLIRRPQAK